MDVSSLLDGNLVVGVVVVVVVVVVVGSDRLLSDLRKADQMALGDLKCFLTGFLIFV